jgi:mycothiol synthase
VELQLPAGYSARPEELDDAAAVCAFLNAEALAATGEPAVAEDEYRSDLQQPSLDLARDTRVAVDSGGAVVAVAEVQFMSPYVHTTLWVRVAREHQGRGLGTALTQWAEARAAERIPDAPANAEVLAEAWNFTAIDAAMKLLGDLGFTPTRTYVNMHLSLDDAPPPGALPEGIRLVSLAEAPEIPLRAIHSAQREGFSDHYGFVERDMDESFREWEHEFTTVRFNPALKFVALEGETIVGLCNCTLAPEDPTDTWVEHLTVLKSWRRKGLAQALLLHAFAALRAAGATRVMLGVDADSLTGATRLYEKVGMQRAREMLLHVNTLRPGTDMARRNLSTE